MQKNERIKKAKLRCVAKTKGGGILFLLFLVFYSVDTHGQQSVNSLAKDLMSRFSGLSGSGEGGDTVSTRPKDEDSILVQFRTFHDVGLKPLDSGVLEVNPDVAEFPLYVNLGNILTATKPVYFDIDPTINFRTNIQVFDKYFWHPNNVPFFQEDKPLTKLGFSTGGTQEQHYYARHSRNFTKTWNVAAGFRLTSSEGYYKNQKSNLANGFVNTNYVSPNERFRAQAAWTTNQLDLQENGGIDFSSIQETEMALGERTFSRRTLLPVVLGQDAPPKTNFFGDFVNTGRTVKQQTSAVQVSYDFGQTQKTVTTLRVPLKDDIKTLLRSLNEKNFKRVRRTLKEHGFVIEHVEDTAKFFQKDSVEGTFTHIVFAPKIRLFAHYEFQTISHLFKDEFYDSINYARTYDALSFKRPHQDSTLHGISLSDQFTQHQATAGVFYFFKKEETSNYLKAYSTLIYYDVMGRSTFQNTDVIVGGDLKIDLWKKNIKADIRGGLTLLGWHQGDNFLDGKFRMNIPLLRSQLSFGVYQSFRSAPFHFTSNSNFYLPTTSNRSWEKEYTLSPFVQLNVAPIKTTFGLRHFVFNNLFYFSNAYTPQQFTSPLNVTQLSMHNHWTFFKHFNYSSDLWFQISSDEGKFPIPTWVTQQRIYVAGLVGGKQDLAMGLEFLIVPDFKPQGYAPIAADWFYQSKETKPTTYTANLFVHFRLRGMFFYMRMQALNTANVEYKDGSFSYPERNNASFILGNYYPGFNLKFGFYWNLIN